MDAESFNRASFVVKTDHDDVREKCYYFENIRFKAMNTCKKPFETILLNLPLNECDYITQTPFEIYEKT